MKLLHDFFRLRPAAVGRAADRGLAHPRDFSVTVPAPLACAALEPTRIAELPATRVVRREPASFLKTSRQRRGVSGR